MKGKTELWVWIYRDSWIGFQTDHIDGKGGVQIETLYAYRV